MALLRTVAGTANVLDHPTDLLVYDGDGAADKGQPDVVVFADSAEQVQGIVRIALEHGQPVTARGAGTGLSGGAVTSQGGILLITTHMHRLLEVDQENRTALVEPGLVNVELSNQVADLGLFYAPDPSSQKSCTLGGNVAENSGGPHCLALGMTTNHVLGLNVVLPNGEALELGGPTPDRPGYDLVGALVGSEGTLAITTRICVRLTRKPEAVRTFLVVFETIAQASQAVSGIIAAGMMPAAMEMIDRLVVQAVEAAFHVGFPASAGAVLIVELDGLTEAVEDDSLRLRQLCRELGAAEVREAVEESERTRLWQARKEAFGALGRIAPNYYIVDTVVPRSQLMNVMQQVTATAEEYQLQLGNVFHAGDGNLHPNILFDARQPGMLERVLECGKKFVEICVAAGGSLSGEHGIGLEKQEFMPLVFNEDDLAQMRRLKRVFNPDHFFNPCKIFPNGHATCAEVPRRPGSDLAAAAW